MIFDKKYFVDVRFEIDASSSEEASRWLSKELEFHQYSDTIENWSIIAITSDDAIDEFEDEEE